MSHEHPVREELAGAFLRRLEAKGIRVRLQGEELSVSGQKAALTPEIQTQLAARKAELLDWLRHHDASAPSTAEAGPPGARIEPVDRGAGLPLSFGQEQIWIIEQLSPGNGAYNIPMAMALRGDVQVDALRQAFDALVDRHEVFRTTIDVDDDGTPVQRIDAGERAALVVIPRAELANADDLDARMRNEVQRPFELEKGPLIRATLFERAPESVLLLSIHHSVADGWSLGVLRSELFDLYEAFRAGGEPDLAPLPIQYADFAAWQRAQWEAGAHERSLSYWREQLSGLPEALDLPIDRTAHGQRSYRGSRVALEISGSTQRRFTTICSEEGASLFMGALGAFQLLLQRFTGQDDLPVGTPIALRGQRETEGLIGNFTNPLVLRGDLSGSPSSRELIRRVRETALSAFEHADVPIEKLVEELRPGRDTSRNPFFQVFFVMQPPTEPLEVGGLEISPHGFDSGRVQLDLCLTLHPAPADGAPVRGELSYNGELFDRDTASRLARHFERIVEAMAAEPERAIDSLNVLDPTSEQQLLVDWNDTAVTLPAYRGVHEWIEWTAASNPDATAVVAPAREGETAEALSSPSSLSYRELCERADALAARLQRSGVTPGDLVAICLERSPELLVAVLAVWKTGAAYVPMDPGFPPARLEQMLSDSGTIALVTESSLLQRLEPGTASVCCIDQPDPEGPADRIDVVIPEDALAYVIYTSGSTGRPKGVEVPHHAVLNFLASMARNPGLDSSDRLLAVTTFSFDIAGLELLLPLCVGGQVVMASATDVYDGRRLADLIEIHGITVMQATPATWRLMLDAGWTGSNHLRALCGGEALPLDLAEVLSRCCAALFNMYGPTETTIWSTLSRVEPEDGSVHIGRPIDNTQIYILDPLGAPVPIGAPGELCIGGDGLARGYRGRPDLTQDRFVDNRFADRGQASQKVYRTGDLARYRPNGDIECLGRLDSQIKLRGFRIELGEIEFVLEQEPDIDQAVVTAYGEAADKRLVAYIKATPDSELDPTTLRERLRGKLPEYMVPAAYVQLEEMPLTPNGKVDRKRLPEPDLDALSESRKYVAPSTPIEAELAEIWQDLLGLSQVGVQDAFFDLGGHSLLAIRMAKCVRDSFGVELSLPAVFDAPTISALARQIEAKPAQGRELAGKTPTRIERADRNSRLPLSFGQEQVWIIEQLAPGNGAYNIPMALVLRGDVRIDALEHAVDTLIKRHEVLRTTIGVESGVPFQLLEASARTELVVVPRTELERLGDFDAHIRSEIQRPFDLEHGPLLRVTLFQRNDDSVLLIAIHHVVADGGSLDVLRQELFDLYRTFSGGGTPALEALPIQYADFAAWQREHWDTPEHERSIGYWREQLSGLPEALDLPTDRPAHLRRSHEGSDIDIAIAPDVCRRLATICSEEGASLFMGALGAFQLLLQRFTGQDDLPVGTPIALREQRETEGLIGNFTNPLVLRGDLSGSPSSRELIRRVRETALSAFEHADVPIEKLVEELRPGRDTGRNPFFQVFFVMQPPSAEIEVAGLEVESYEFDAERTQLDLTLALQQSERNERGLRGELSYNGELFDRDTASRLARHFERIVEAMAAEPERAIDSLNVLDPTSEQQLLVDWNDTAVTLPAYRGVHEWIERTAASNPDATAVVAPAREGETAEALSSPSSLSYRELCERADALAARLQRSGVTPGDLVAICLERSPELLVAVLAVWKTGAAYVPMDPGFPPARLEQMLSDSGTTALVTESSLLQRLEPGTASVCCIDQPDPEGPADRIDVVIPEDALAYVIYTSGSTGRPKGVEVPHHAVLNFLASMARNPGLDSSDRLLAVTTFSFDIAGLELLLPLCVGGQVVMASATDVYDGRRLADLIEIHGITVMQATPATWRLMLDAGWTGSNHLRALCGGEALPLDLAEVLSRCCAALFNMYGPTETTIWSTLSRVEPEDGSVHIGRPIDNTQIYILDPLGAPVPIGAPGELCIGGDGLARGYRGRPDLTQDRFVDNRFADRGHASQKVYRTGDLARYRPNGDIECLGRLDSQIKLRGFRIELGEIEFVLEQEHDIDQAVVTAYGEAAEKRLVAYIKATPDSELDPTSLRERLRGKLPEYMVPAAYVQLDEMPLTPNGKVDRKRLPEPDLDVAVGKSDDTAPRNELETTIAAIWGELLGLERVGVHTPFFDVGGHSLLGLRIVAEINLRLGASLPPALLFEHPTVAGLAALLSGDATPPAFQATDPGQLMPSARDTDLEGVELADVERVARVMAERLGNDKRGPGGGRKPYRMRRSWIARRVLAPLFAVKRGSVRRLLKWMILRLEGGGMYSLTLREVWKKHFDVEVGDFSTGGFDPESIKPGMKIGRYSVVMHTSRSENANHPVNTFSSNAVFYRDSFGFSPGVEIPRNRLEIGNDVFIGHNATILYPTQKIGDGAIIGAHAVVTADVPPFAVMAGYPAVVVRYRFSEKMIQELLRLRWWDASLEELETVREEFIRPVEGKQLR